MTVFKRDPHIITETLNRLNRDRNWIQCDDCKSFDWRHNLTQRGRKHYCFRCDHEEPVEQLRSTFDRMWEGR